MREETAATALGRQFRGHALLAVIVGLYAVVSFSLNQASAEPIDPSKFGLVFLRFAELVPQMIFMVLFWRLLHLTYVQKSPDRMGDLKRDLRAFLADRERLLGGLIAVVIMTIMLVSFSQLKNRIPAINPFSWDLFFVELDRAMHFGTLPHEYLHAVLGGHYAISFFTGIYNVWLFLMYFALVIACFMRPDSALRLQFLVAFVLTWAIGGNLLATVFSSAGPVYLDDLGLGDTYATLMDRLQAHASTGALTVIDTQNLLWRWYTGTPQINAISAFPSMHVASTTLLAIFAFAWTRWAGIAASIFGLLIMIGSVLLAWHYAVDGYAGALIAMASWGVAGWMVRRLTPLRAG